MERSFSKNKDVDREILQRLNDMDLFQTLLTSKYFKEITNNDAFWRNRLLTKYPSAVPYKQHSDISWKNYYLSTVFYVNELKEKGDYQYIDGDPKFLYKYLVLLKYNFQRAITKLFKNGYIDAALKLFNDVRKDFKLSPVTMEEFLKIRKNG